MDYLDTRKTFRHHVLLIIGYILIAFGIATATLVLLYQAYGFSLTQNGSVIQNGLVFFSSQPNPARIYVNGTLSPKQTNTRLELPSNIYQITIARDGYRDWRREVNIDGGSVTHFDYPFLIPKTLQPQKVQAYQNAPPLTLQTPDRRWLFVANNASIRSFDVYDLKNITATAPVSTLTLPDGLMTKATQNESLELAEWSNDNRHVLLKHIYDGGRTEFIMVDRTEVAQSVNLNTTFNISPVRITLVNKKYDQYYVHQADGRLQLGRLKQATLTDTLSAVTAYKSYGDTMILYVTTQDAPTGKVLVRLADKDSSYTIRTLAASTRGYLVDLTEYDNHLYVAAGSQDDTRVYVYRDPLDALSDDPPSPLGPVQVLHVSQPNRLSFSSSAQFIAAENGNQFSVYDIENELGFNYTTASTLDAPQSFAPWMDGHRFVYVSGGAAHIADYDNVNHQKLVPAIAQHGLYFAADFKYLYSFASASNGQVELTRTPLLTPQDL